MTTISLDKSRIKGDIEISIKERIWN
jgi:hypothetical protein